MVELTRVELENFCSFYNKHDIDLPLSNKKLIVCEGDNGSGKTNLLRAIHWCLFGIYQADEPDIKKADFALFNDDVLINSNIKEPITCRVTLTFSEENVSSSKDRITFSRSMKIRKTRSLSKTSSGAVDLKFEDFEFIELTDKSYKKFNALKWRNTEQIKTDRSSNSIREQYFPLIVNDYYMIYGEAFVDPSSREKIRVAIERNCFSGIFDKIKENLGKVQEKIIQENTKDKKYRERIIELIDNKEDIVEQIKLKREDIKKAETTFIQLQSGITKLDREIGKSGSKQAELLKKERDEKESELKQLKKDIKEIGKKIINEGFQILIQLYGENAENKLIEELESRIKRGQIPPKIRVEFINTLIDKKNCICKRPINEKEKKALEELRDETKFGENFEQFLNLKFRLKSNIENLSRNVNEYCSKLANIEKLKEKRTATEERLKVISDELSTLKDVVELERQRIELERLKTNISADKEILKQELNELTENLKKIEKEIRKIGDIGSEEDKELDKFIEEISEIVEKSKENIVNSTRMDVQQFASGFYKQLFKGTAEVSRVDLDNDFSVRVILNKNEKEYVKTKFSQGEALVFAISFLTALRKYSGYDGPIFLDSPYSVLDPEHRVNVSLNLPNTIPGQLIIFTRRDTFEDIVNKMKPYLNKIITLKKEKEWHTAITIRGES